jgi:hypothetical protein
MSRTAVPLKNAPFPVLSNEQLQVIIDRHGLSVAVDQVHRLESMGIVHSI